MKIDLEEIYRSPEARDGFVEGLLNQFRDWLAHFVGNEGWCKEVGTALIEEQFEIWNSTQAPGNAKYPFDDGRASFPRRSAKQNARLAIIGDEISRFKEMEQAWAEQAMYLIKILWAAVNPVVYNKDGSFTGDTFNHEFLEDLIGSYREDIRSDPLASALPPQRLLTARGRPPVYRWQEFSAEMTRRCIEGPINTQAELENHMTKWCATQWGTEPAPSMIRDWVAPTFRIINGLSAAEKSATDLPANTA